MRLANILGPIFALSMLIGCSNETSQQGNNSSDINNDATIDQSIKSNVPIKQIQERSFDDVIDGECYFLLTLRNSALKNSVKPENFDTAKGYFESRVLKHFNVDFDQSDWALKILNIQNQYMDKLSDKYGLANLSNEAEVQEPVCITIAEAGLNLSSPPAP